MEGEAPETIADPARPPLGRARQQNELHEMVTVGTSKTLADYMLRAGGRQASDAEVLPPDMPDVR